MGVSLVPCIAIIACVGAAFRRHTAIMTDGMDAGPLGRGSQSPNTAVFLHQIHTKQPFSWTPCWAPGMHVWDFSASDMEGSWF